VLRDRPGAAGLIGTAEAAKAPADGYTLLVVASPHINLEILSHNRPYQLMRDFVAISPAVSTDAVMVVHPSVPAKTVKELAGADPDGHTLLMISTSNVVTQPLHPDYPYDLRALTPITEVSRGPLILVARKELPISSVADLIAYATRNPGKLTFGSSGPGSNKHLGGELFKLMTGTDILHVAYKGSTGARNDIVGGHIDMMFDEVPSVGPNVLAGQVRALGVTGRQRVAMLPDVPLVSDTVPGYEHTGWFGLMVPTGTPRPIIDKLNAAMRELVARKDVQEFWEKQATSTMSMTPEECTAYLRAEIDKWAKVVKEGHITLQ
jgi:tripartite-type tricarboxylate transporter receptor subunit TctC